MIKYWYFILIFCGINVNTIYSQEEDLTRDFEITAPEFKVENSLYNSIEVIDSRSDTTNLGIVQVGLLNFKADVITKIPLSTQISSLFHLLIDPSANNGKILFQIKQLKFREVTGSMTEMGYCSFIAQVYSKNENRYNKLASIDTMIQVKSMDATKPLLKAGSKIITDFLSSTIIKQSYGSRSFSLIDIHKMDSLEKRDILVYNTDRFADGLYYTFNSFSSQTPDRQVKVKKNRDGKISSIEYINENGIPIKIKSKDIYSVVHNGIPYISTEYGYYQLIKSKDDLCFIGKVNVSADLGDVIVSSFFFGGAIGGLITNNTNAMYYIKIDHNNGAFIPLKEIKANFD